MKRRALLAVMFRYSVTFTPCTVGIDFSLVAKNAVGILVHEIPGDQTFPAGSNQPGTNNHASRSDYLPINSSFGLMTVRLARA